jgi:hypothetical protein
MKNLKYVSAFALVATLQLTTIGAFAQPDPNNVPKVENPANRPVGGGRNRPAQQLTPAALQAMMEQRAKQQLQRAGITDIEQQEAIITYTKEEQEADTKIRQKGQELQRVIRADTLSNAQLVALVNEYHVALEENKERHTKALAKLKEAIDFNTNPRIEAFLMLSGLYGDGPVISNFNINTGGLGGRNFIAQMGGAQGGAPQGAPPQRGAAFGQFGARPNPAQGNAPQTAAPQGVMPFGQFGIPQGQNNQGARNGENAPRRNRPRNNTPEAPAAPLN